MTLSKKGSTSSAVHHEAADWQSSSLLAKPKAKTPQFLRSSWDESASSSFGPWKLVPRLDPTDGQSRHASDAAALAEAEAQAQMQGPSAQPVEAASTDTDAPPTDATGQLVEPPAPHWVGISEQELEQTRAQAYEQGLAAGVVQAREQWEAERAQEKELLRHLGIELRALNQDSQRFFEPLRKLSLHVAEQLVRAELQVNAQVVERLISQCVQALEQPGAKVTVSLNPQDLKRLQALGEDALKEYQLEADDNLREGSVRVRVNDTAVQDLIEHRLEAMAARLLSDPGAWPAKSVLLRPASAEDVAADVDRPGLMARADRPWARTKVDVQDVQDVQDVKDVKDVSGENATPARASSRRNKPDIEDA